MTWISLEVDINMKVYTSPQPMIFFCEITNMQSIIRFEIYLKCKSVLLTRDVLQYVLFLQPVSWWVNV